MAGQNIFELEGGMTQPTLGTTAGTLGRTIQGSGAPPSHYSVIALVLFAVVGLWALNKFGFRFAVTAGR